MRTRILSTRPLSCLCSDAVGAELWEKVNPTDYQTLTQRNLGVAQI